MPLQPYHYLQEDIFGFSGYVCSECMTVNAKILKFSSQHLGLASNYSLIPCDHHGYGVPMDPEHYNSYLQESGFIKPLKDWVLNVWSRVPFFKIVAYQVPDPLVLGALGNKITNQKFRLKITRGKKWNHWKHEKEDYLSWLWWYQSRRCNSRTCKYEPSFLSCGHIYQIILNAISTYARFRSGSRKLPWGNQMEHFWILSIKTSGPRSGFSNCSISARILLRWESAYRINELTMSV